MPHLPDFLYKFFDANDQSKASSITALLNSGHDYLSLVEGQAGSGLSSNPVTADGQVFVTVGGDDSNDGLSWGSAKETLAAAYAAVTSGGRIRLGVGTFPWSSTITPPSGVTLEGSGTDLRAGSNGTLISFTGSGFGFDLTGIAGCAWENLRVQINSPAAGFCDMGASCYRHSFERLQVNGYSTSTGTAFRLHGQGTCQCFNRWDQVDCQNFGTLWQFSGDSNGNELTDINGGSCTWFFDSSKILTDTHGGTDNVFERIEMNGGTANGIREADQSSRNTYIKVQQDGVTTAGLSAAGGGGSVFITCYFQGSFSDTTSHASTNLANRYIACGGVPAGYADRSDTLRVLTQLVIGTSNPSTTEPLVVNGTVSLATGGSGQGVWMGSEGSAAAGGALLVRPQLASNITKLQVSDGSALVDVLGMAASSGAAKLGFGTVAAAPIAVPTVTGSRGGNAALASALTALANLGLVVDSSTA